jgi:hypothetical protein
MNKQFLNVKVMPHQVDILPDGLKKKLCESEQAIKLKDVVCLEKIQDGKIIKPVILNSHCK